MVVKYFLNVYVNSDRNQANKEYKSTKNIKNTFELVPCTFQQDKREVISHNEEELFVTSGIIIMIKLMAYKYKAHK